MMLAHAASVLDGEQIVVNGQKLNRAQAVALERAAVLASGSLEERRQSAAMVRRIESQLAAAREAEAVSSGIVETVANLGGARAGVGLEVIEIASFVRDSDGVVVRHQGEPVLKVETATRAKRVDGLESLWKSGALSDQALADGMLYRQTVARAQASVGSSLNERAAAPRMSSDGAVWSALERGLAAVRLSLVRTAIGDARAMVLVDAVAGRGVTIRSLGGGGNERTSNTARLSSALGVAGPLLRVSDDKLKRAIANRGR